jgi:cytochrome P450
MMEEIQTMVSTGSDTTAITLSFATIMLALHQGIQEKEKRCATYPWKYRQRSYVG